MLKPYEAKLQSIKDEIQKVGVDVIESLELCLEALKENNINDLKNIEITEKNYKLNQMKLII